MISFYTEESHSDETSWLKYLIHPIRAYWGDGTKEWSKWKDNFSFYKDYFKIVRNIKDCDVGFLPLTLNYYVKEKKIGLVNKMANLMKKNDQLLYIWVDGDHSINYSHPNCIILKYFGNSVMKTNNEIIRAGDMKKDLLNEHYHGVIKIRNKSDIPVVGFDGIANYQSIKLISTVLKNSFENFSYKFSRKIVKPDPIIPALVKRKKLLNRLKRSYKIETNFKIRNSFAIGTVGRNNQARKDFIKNIISSDYTFCYRGAANYSLRFYETLCLGRIPLFINTNCILPFNEEIDWENIVLWIDENEKNYMIEKIYDYHHSMTNNQFIEKQYYCREIWSKYLSKKGFIKNIHDKIKNSASLNFNPK